MLGGPVGGYITDKVLHSATKYLRIVFIITGAMLLTFAFLPHSKMNVYIGMVMTPSIGACVFSRRAIFFAPMDEVDVPREITGSAMSPGAFIGYLPGAFMYSVYGSILDRAPGCKAIEQDLSSWAYLQEPDFYSAAISEPSSKKKNAHNMNR